MKAVKEVFNGKDDRKMADKPENKAVESEEIKGTAEKQDGKKKKQASGSDPGTDSMSVSPVHRGRDGPGGSCPNPESREETSSW